MFARQSSNGTKRASLYVSGLPVFFGEKDVRELFAAYHPIIDCKVLMTPEGESRGVASIMMGSLPLANRAIAELDNSIPKNASSRISIKLAEESPPAPRRFRGVSNPMLSMPMTQGMPPMMGGAFPPNPYGAPYMPPMPYPAQPPTSYGPMRHDRSMERVNPMGVSPMRAPAVQQPGDPYAPGENPASNGYCLFTYNLPSEYDEAMLTSLYAPYGVATEVKIMRDPTTHQSRVSASTSNYLFLFSNLGNISGIWLR